MDLSVDIALQLHHHTDDPWHLVKRQIDFIISTYQVALNYHDLVGMSFSHDLSRRVSEPYLSHNNSFCNKIKANPNFFPKCVEQKSKLIHHMEKTLEPLYGQCYQGFEEFVFPIVVHRSLIGLLCFGFCQCAKTPENLHPFIDEVNILRRLFENIYFEFERQLRLNPFQEDTTLKSKHIVHSTLKFIQEHYSQDLSLDLLADNAHCNPTYLSTQFKKIMHIGITDCINEVRIKASLFFLSSTKMTITAISQHVGYNDPSYFTRVFKKHQGLSPNAYRERFNTI